MDCEDIGHGTAKTSGMGQLEDMQCRSIDKPLVDASEGGARDQQREDALCLTL